MKNNLITILNSNHMNIFISRLIRQQQKCNKIPVNCYALCVKNPTTTCNCSIQCKYLDNYLDIHTTKTHQQRLVTDFMDKQR